jgi:RNA polymerase sigma-70 factor (ECF subfamily)
MARSEELPDDELLLRVADGHHEALAILYRRYQNMVFRFAVQMVGSEATAEDVMQDTFLTLARSARKYRGGTAKFSTYLYGIVRNLTRRRLRRESRFASLHGWMRDNPNAQPVMPGVAPIERVIQQQTVERVRRAVLSLKPHYREVVILCELHGQDYTEAAAVIGCPVGTIRSRLFRARGLLAAKLADTRDHAR